MCDKGVCAPDQNSSNSTERPDDDWTRIAGQDEFRYISNVILTALSCLGVILNVSIIRFSRKLRSLTGDLTHSFVCSMAVADLLLCCFAQPFEFILDFLITAKLLALPDWICRLQHMIYWLGYSASGLSLTLLNFDKLIFFKWPLHYGSIDADKTAKYSISISWLLCSLGTIVMVVPGALELSTSGDCQTTGVSPELYIFYTVAFCLIPILSSALVSVYLAHLVTKMQQKNRDEPRYVKSSDFSDNSTQQRLRAMAYIFITTAWTFLALSPFRLFNIVRLYYMSSWYESPSTYRAVSWLGHVFIFILALNPFVDACLTLFTYAPYKNLAKASFASFKKHVQKMPCCNKCFRKEKIDWV